VSDAAAAFFDTLAAREHEPALAKTRGSIRFDLKDGDGRTARWLVSVSKGEVEVSRRTARADCVVRLDRALFVGLVSGERNALASVLRGAIEIEGDASLLVAFQRLFPGRGAA
jgi:predicted lipid carrier protein YhbT